MQRASQFVEHVGRVRGDILGVGPYTAQVEAAGRLSELAEQLVRAEIIRQRDHWQNLASAMLSQSKCESKTTDVLRGQMDVVVKELELAVTAATASAAIAGGGETDDVGGAAAGKKRKKDRKPKDPNAPKRPLSSYLLFCVPERKKLSASNPEMKGRAVMAELGRRWGLLPEDQKKPFKDEAEKLAAAHAVAVQAYKATKVAVFAAEVVGGVGSGSSAAADATHQGGSVTEKSSSSNCKICAARGGKRCVCTLSKCKICAARGNKRCACKKRKKAEEKKIAVSGGVGAAAGTQSQQEGGVRAVMPTLGQFDLEEECAAIEGIPGMFDAVSEMARAGEEQTKQQQQQHQRKTKTQKGSAHAAKGAAAGASGQEAYGNGDMVGAPGVKRQRVDGMREQDALMGELRALNAAARA